MPGEGITIEREIIKKNKDDWGRPAIQVFLVFTDQTYYERYDDEVGVAGGVDQGGREAVLGYMSHSMQVVYEGLLDEEGTPAYEFPSQKANSQEGTS